MQVMSKVSNKLCHYKYCIYQVYCVLFYIINDAEIIPPHSTWKVAEKGYNLMAFMMHKLAVINSCEIILEK
jgi:hypothetical protein